jgi:hypothetical protein
MRALEVGEDAALVEEAEPGVLGGVGQDLHSRRGMKMQVLAPVHRRGAAAADRREDLETVGEDVAVMK